MSDICKCTGFDCENKEQCYRYRIPDSAWQVYFAAKPNKGPNDCEYFIPVCDYELVLDEGVKYEK